MLSKDAMINFAAKFNAILAETKVLHVFSKLEKEKTNNGNRIDLIRYWENKELKICPSRHRTKLSKHLTPTMEGTFVVDPGTVSNSMMIWFWSN